MEVFKDIGKGVMIDRQVPGEAKGDGIKHEGVVFK